MIKSSVLINSEAARQVHLCAASKAPAYAEGFHKIENGPRVAVSPSEHSIDRLAQHVVVIRSKDSVGIGEF